MVVVELRRLKGDVYFLSGLIAQKVPLIVVELGADRLIRSSYIPMPPRQR
jgi:hypothetical protein